MSEESAGEQGSTSPSLKGMPTVNPVSSSDAPELPREFPSDSKVAEGRITTLSEKTTSGTEEFRGLTEVQLVIAQLQSEKVGNEKKLTEATNAIDRFQELLVQEPDSSGIPPVLQPTKAAEVELLASQCFGQALGLIQALLLDADLQAQTIRVERSFLRRGAKFESQTMGTQAMPVMPMVAAGTAASGVPPQSNQPNPIAEALASRIGKKQPETPQRIVRPEREVRDLIYHYKQFVPMLSRFSVWHQSWLATVRTFPTRGYWDAYFEVNFWSGTFLTQLRASCEAAVVQLNIDLDRHAAMLARSIAPQIPMMGQAAASPEERQMKTVLRAMANNPEMAERIFGKKALDEAFGKQ